MVENPLAITNSAKPKLRASSAWDATYSTGDKPNTTTSTTAWDPIYNTGDEESKASSLPNSTSWDSTYSTGARKTKDNVMPTSASEWNDTYSTGAKKNTANSKRSNTTEWGPTYHIPMQQEGSEEQSSYAVVASSLPRHHGVAPTFDSAYVEHSTMLPKQLRTPASHNNRRTTDLSEQSTESSHSSTPC